MNELKKKRDLQTRLKTSSGYNLKSTLEKVLEVLGDLRNELEVSEHKRIQDLNYCIKMIQQNKLYDGGIEMFEEEENNSDNQDGENSDEN